MTIQEVLRLGTIDALDRELFLASVLKCDRAFILAHPEYTLSKTQVKRFKQLLKRREENEPLAYILGEKEFFGISFSVNPATLIPRPETELLVEEALKLLTRKRKSTSKKKIAVIDVGTGSGNIIISLAKNLFEPNKLPTTNYQLLGFDISKRALALAKKNAERHHVQEKIIFRQSDLLEAFKKELNNFDTIILLANLPYLSEKIYAASSPTVHDFEPKRALVSGQDGLNHYRKLLQQIRPLSQGKKVCFFLEISPEQASLLPALFTSFGVKKYQVFPDLTGRPRLVNGTF
ncbi:MAG: peptide chain release factor N(5)-glutamine methyltransferase [Candidatus Moraniibacteriota bacterium]|nr:MAG: peptide chain release factor N(5)-glutamine methyltransferase [Candidatus Moranbacteria bacterium]